MSVPSLLWRRISTPKVEDVGVRYRTVVERRFRECLFILGCINGWFRESSIFAFVGGSRCARTAQQFTAT